MSGSQSTDSSKELKPLWAKSSAQNLGEIVARLRTKRRLSRPRMVDQVLLSLNTDDPLRRSISESWLKDIENGTRAHVTRPMIEALCKALKCTPIERIQVMLAADLNILADAQGKTSSKAMLVLQLAHGLYNHPIASQMIESLSESQDAPILTEHDLSAILNSIARMIDERNIKHLGFCIPLAIDEISAGE